MSAEELAEMRAKAELEMFYLMTVEEGAKYLEWCESQTHPLQELRERSIRYDSREWRRQHPSGHRAG